MSLRKMTNELLTTLLQELKQPENRKKVDDSLGSLLSLIWNHVYVYFFVVLLLLFLIIILLCILIYLISSIKAYPVLPVTL